MFVVLRPVTLLVAFALCAPGIARADNQAWTSFILQARARPDSGPTFWFDGHSRRRGDGHLTLTRPGVGWTFNPNLMVHVGYLYLELVTDEGPNPAEHRVFEQVIYNHALSDQVKLQFRGRLEQRFGPGDEIGHRLRTLARVQIQPWELPLQFIVWDELFTGFNDTDWNAWAGFDQSRLCLCVGTDTKIRGTRVEAGYLNIYRANKTGDRFVDHAVLVWLISTIAPSS